MLTLFHATRESGCIAVPPRPRRLLLQLPVGLALRWIDRSRQRRALANCDDRLLHDIGITRAQADRESAKPFWRLD